MKLFERNLYNIIEEIERYGSIDSIKIGNSEIKISIPKSSNNPDKTSKLKTLDLSKPNKFMIEFVMGDIKEKI